MTSYEIEPRHIKPIYLKDAAPNYVYRVLITHASNHFFRKDDQLAVIRDSEDNNFVLMPDHTIYPITEFDPSFTVQIVGSIADIKVIVKVFATIE